MASIRLEGARYTVREGESALDALVRGGADVQFSCRRGACHSCVLRVVAGDAGLEAQRGLSEDQRRTGHFLPCQSFPHGELTVEPPRLQYSFVVARLREREAVSERIVRLLLSPERELRCFGGQFVNVRARGVVRSYSIASSSDGGSSLELHVQRTPGGALSGYLCDELALGAEVEVQGPLGTSTYDATAPHRRLLLLGTGSGLAPLLGVLRDALRHGHTGPITLYHGAREPEGLYLQAHLRQLAAAFSTFEYVPCLSGTRRDGYAEGRVTALAFARHRKLDDTSVYLAGAPAMVHEARYLALLAGVDRERVFADPFYDSAPYLPNDGAKVSALPTEPELWEALERGPGLTRILTDFYDAVYADDRLAPFFHNVTKQRAIEKQYEFLREVFTRETTFFGLRPFNAHHWMVISDELFDYRERLMESMMRRHGLPTPLVRRWLALHEAFRREIVKGEPRGLVVDGVEHRVDGYSKEVLSLGSVCDGCGEEIPSGAEARMHRRTGKLFCEQCAAST
jgi:ferredoxin-NADP reductase/ferredoxin/truncated hemoglobin YjbI